MKKYLIITCILLLSTSGILQGMQLPPAYALRDRLITIRINTQLSDSLESLYKHLENERCFSSQLRNEFEHAERLSLRQLYASIETIVDLITEFQNQLGDTEIDRAAFKETLNTYHVLAKKLFERTQDTRTLYEMLLAENKLRLMAERTHFPTEKIAPIFEDLHQILEAASSIKQETPIKQQMIST